MSDSDRTGEDKRSASTFEPSRSGRNLTCSKQHFLRNRNTTPLMDSETDAQPVSPAPSGISSQGSMDMARMLQFLSQQNTRQEERHAEEMARRQAEERRKHDLDMYKLQADLYKLQMETDKAKADEEEKWRKLQDEQQAAQSKSYEEEQKIIREKKEKEGRRLRDEANRRHLKRELTKLTDKDSAPIFMSYFELLAAEHMVPREAWSACFTHCLSGHELNTWSSLLTNSADDSYDVVKPLFLDRLGYDWDSCAKRISCPKNPAHLSYDQYSQEFMLALDKIVDTAVDVQSAKELILKACFSNFLYGFKRTELCQKRNTPLPVFLKFLSDCDYNARAVLGSRELPTTYKRSFSDRRPYPVDSCSPVPPSVGPKPSVGLEEVKTDPLKKVPPQSNFTVTCHNCGEPGHIRPNCPLRSKPKNLGRVLTDSEPEQSDYLARGKVNGVSRDIYLDTGAQMCVIPSQWCLNSDVSTKKVVISSVFGTKRQTEVAKVSVELFGHVFSCEAALIDGEETDQLLLGISIGTDLLWDLLKARHETSYRVCETRVQSKKQQEEELRCKQLDEQDGATPHLDAPIVESQR